nr:solute binding protein-like protein [uncultured archaeon]
MHKAPVLASGIIVLLLLSTLPAFSQAEEKGAYIDQVQFIERQSEDLALQEVRSGDLDMYHFKIPLEAADDANDDPRLKVYDRTAGSMTLFVNPAPAKDDSVLNPFQFREVRYALNYLVDREFVVDEILKGYGSPMVDPFGIYSPEYLLVIDIVESFGFRYNPQLAESMITEALTNAGATKEDDKWMYNDRPITIKFLIRQDDAPRKSMGESLASKLEEIGFTVQKEYGDLSKANTIVLGSDPAELQWQIYTEGFAGTSVFVKYNPIITGQMYGSWYGRMPGSQNPAFWNYQNSTLDEITQRIFFFNFTSEEERNELVRQAVKAGIQESVRIFVAQKTDPFVASSDLEGLVNDFGAGITSKYSLLNARTPNGNSLKIGVKFIHQGSWNGVGGLSDTYSRDIYYSLIDTATFRHPYTGEIIPQRAEWTSIETEGPTGKLDVAPDALVWDPALQEWKQAEESQTISKVTFNLLYSNWHNGIPMDRSDLMYVEYFLFEWGTDLGPDDLTVDPEYTSQVQAAIPLLKGIRFTALDKVESYIDQWHYDDKEIADSAAIWATEPWEITAATERLVKSGEFAYSRSQATAKDAKWLDPILPEHANAIKTELQRMKNENFVPPALQGIVSAQDAARRYDASIAWIEEHGHAIIGNGAFYLDSYNVAGKAITIKAFRDESYPFEVGHFAEYETPKLADIVSVNARPITIAQPASMTVNVEVDGQPSSDAIVDYFVFDKNGYIAIKGKAEPSDSAGEFLINISGEETAKLSAGPSQLRVFASSNDALRPDITQNTILATTVAGGNQTQNQTGGGQGQQGQQPSGCLIATAAFGSELTPQVQYLRSFREQYILSTVTGSAFMSAFNSVYYSFSPQVADYEREQPWLQATVKTGLYPLFGILTAAEQSYSIAGGELGSMTAGATASALIGAVYLWPAALSSRLQSRYSIAVKILLLTIAMAAAIIAIGMVAGNTLLLSAGTSFFVLSIATASALSAGKLIRIACRRISSTSRY